MSVICIEDRKFLEVAETLKTNAREYMYIFGYPEGWQVEENQEHIINSFCDDLYRANQLTYQRQYGENHEDARFPIEALKFVPAKRLSKIQLYKRLRSISYNLYDNGGKETDILGCTKRLNRLIAHIANDIISEMPEYQKAEWA